MYPRLLGLAAHALAEGLGSHEPEDLWQETFLASSAWKPCSDKDDWKQCEQTNGYIIVSANGGINQQRVAVCNAVAVARLLNATLVVPKFLLNSVWRDESKFGDIYQEEFFINYLKDDIRIVKELPEELQSLDLRAIGSIVTDSDIKKEAKPSFFLKRILPILLQNRVVHFVGFAHRLAFDPVPVKLQRLRCRCNFHALKFAHKIQETGALLVRRMHQQTLTPSVLDDNLLGHFRASSTRTGEKFVLGASSKYLAMHLRFEIDMAAYSLCEFGGGAEEKKELDTFRAIHFPALTLFANSTEMLPAGTLRSEGLCPLTPEEAAIMLAALGLKRTTRIYLAGAHIYGGISRMVALTSLFPNLVTKEDLLSSKEIEPFKNFSSQLAALDFIGCAAADSFVMTDPGSQLSSLVAGYRAYFGGGRLPTIRPNKRRLAGLLLKNSTIEWSEFQVRVKKAFRESEKIQGRPKGRSIYRHPRSHECMCKKG
ncbi:Uncharacterized protein EJ110_NYTH58821 [Nymphaea thermarum]|nr:Uncharacterized protein EJ110_NYTH58821 [Nymphaea thermarum]